jgi:pyridoxal phosphate enzyme (YggS family)
MEPSIQDNIAAVRERIEAALRRSGRSGDRVTVVGITKKFGYESVIELIRAGIEDIGENRIQEFTEKQPLVTLPCRWHLVGSLQRNKATKAIGQFHLIHSIDSVRLAETLNRLGEERNIVTRILLQVNTSGESTKHGFAPDETVDRAGEISRLPFLKLEGLMTIGPFTQDVPLVRRSFQILRDLGDRIRSSFDIPLPELSMGMSDDFEIAVEEGATIVRLGTILLGERPR